MTEQRGSSTHPNSELTPDQDIPDLQDRTHRALLRALRIASAMADPDWMGEDARYTANLELVAILSDALLDVTNISRRSLA